MDSETSNNQSSKDMQPPGKVKYQQGFETAHTNCILCFCQIILSF